MSKLEKTIPIQTSIRMIKVGEAGLNSTKLSDTQIVHLIFFTILLMAAILR
jgi:hypothetical protein